MARSNWKRSIEHNDAPSKSQWDLSCDDDDDLCVCVCLSFDQESKSPQSLVFMLERKANNAHLNGQQRLAYDKDALAAPALQQLALL